MAAARPAGTRKTSSISFAVYSFDLIMDSITIYQVKSDLVHSVNGLKRDVNLGFGYGKYDNRFCRRSLIILV